MLRLIAALFLTASAGHAYAQPAPRELSDAVQDVRARRIEWVNEQFRVHPARQRASGDLRALVAPPPAVSASWTWGIHPGTPGETLFDKLDRVYQEQTPSLTN
ncbi:MAG TPA: hypothetical protein VFV50_19320 [Bdellovibrionales bacterium]|nr:hypothetical protein [Bdellovibrionales bacterium]